MNPIRHHRAAGGLVAALLAGLVSAPLLATAADAGAPPAAAAKRPKICLVLSGGGARGAAHTGVIKVLEELRVPIDCITGTSMGALVGGAYATGMSVDEMDAVMAGMSVEKLFKEKPPRQELAIRRKMDSYINYVGPEIGVGSAEAVVTKGVVSGVQLETVLRQLTKVRGYQNFDKLPIQFRAVATDLVTGKAVIFKDGEMANVMRASMSVPGAVAPAEIGGMILVDGMLTSNLPVETARALGADVVIAVNVGTPLLKREQLTSIVGVAGQMLSILTEQNVQASIASLKPTDILISPELGDFSTGDFDNLPKIAPLGEAAARLVAEQLSRYSLPPAEFAALRIRQRAPVSPDLNAVDEIRFVNLKRVNPVEALAVMTTTANAPIDQAKLDADMRRLYGTGDYEHLNYRVLNEGDKRVLAVDAVEKSWGPDYLRIGLELDSNFGNESRASLFATYRKTWVNSLGAEWRTDLRLGYDNGLRSEFYQPFAAASGWFAAPSIGAARRSVPVYQGDNRVAIYAVGTAQAGLDLGRHFYQYGEIRLGVVGGQQRQTIDTGPDQLKPSPERVQVGGLTGRLVMDRLDSVLFPRSGWKGTVNLYSSVRDLGADVDYGKWGANANFAYSLGDNTFNLGLVGGGRLNNTPIPAYDQFQWGGFLQQSGYAPGQLLGEEVSFGRLMYYRRISQGKLFEGAYGGVSLEMGRVTKPLIPTNSEDMRKSMALFVGIDTLVGPLYLGLGRANDGATSAYLVLGPAF